MENELNKCGEGCGCGHDHDSHGCGDNCGCGEHEHEHFVVDLEDDNGNVISCPIVDAFEFEENEYVLAQNPEDESVYLFRSTEELKRLYRAICIISFFYNLLSIIENLIQCFQFTFYR